LGKFLGQAIDIVEIAIGLVLVLLVKFGIVKGLIVKFGRTVFMFDRIIRGRRRFDGMRVGNYVESASKP
jgi:hypothetical protein